MNPMNDSRIPITIATNCIAKNCAVDVWDTDMPADFDPQELARRTLSYWFTEQYGHLVPLVSPENGAVPDEIVIRARRGKMLGRWTIVDEINARFEAGVLS
jgi:hypothetical protein